MRAARRFPRVPLRQLVRRRLDAAGDALYRRVRSWPGAAVAPLALVFPPLSGAIDRRLQHANAQAVTHAAELIMAWEVLRAARAGDTRAHAWLLQDLPGDTLTGGPAAADRTPRPGATGPGY